jgi:predicted ribosome quality control (RQC) complex YloA/Tae2 family protein
MKSETTSLDLFFLTKEFQELVGGKVDKVFQKADDKKDLLFVFHVTGKGKRMLRFKLPGLAYLTETKEEYPESPPGYCMFLRKYLSQARLQSIGQVGFQRMLKLTFEKWVEKKSEKYILIVELFSKGNMILCDSEMKIKNPLENQHWTGREVRGKQLYVFPPEQTDTPHLDGKQFADILLHSDRESLVKSLAIDFALGGSYAEEVVARAKMDKTKKPKDLNPKDAVVLHATLASILSLPMQAIKVGEHLLPFPFITLPADHHAPSGIVEYPSFSAAIDRVHTAKAGQKQEQEHKEKTRKIDVIIAAQDAKIKEFEEAAKDNQRKGELIYEHYQDLKALLADINILRKEKGWKAVKEKYKGHAIVKEIDEKKGTITIAV